ncbi:oligosaccharide flippase family protein [Cohnella cholangitidis]|uniref:Oligosaccharide flippase family protein n=1 Tax=Cohnella cholangitidis TaxID=2598458 RepID=A0A7G5BWP1_9BACL|nr:oligosaccharide flippase family protein [Cohnella cholangitidis]QMV41375.1 oligosaccharide flippase family protein [Cohnella cholangitidis]
MSRLKDTWSEASRRFFRGITWNIAASLISQGSSFLGTIIAARLLGKIAFGEWSIVQSTVFMVVTIASAGMSITPSKIISEHRDSDPARTGRFVALCLTVSMGVSFIYAVGLFVLAPWIAGTVLHEPQLAMLLRISSVYVFFWSVWWCQIGILYGLEAFTRLTELNVIQAIASLTLAFVLTYEFGLSGAAWALSLSSLSAFWLHTLAIRKECRRQGIVPRITGMWGEGSLLYRLTLPAAVSGIVGGTAIWTSHAALATRSNGIEEMAVFNAANVLRNLVVFVPGLIARVASPILSNLLGKGDLHGYRKTLRSNLGMTVSVAFFVAAAVAVGSPYLLKAYGSDFGSGHSVLVYLAVSAILETIAVGLYQSLFANSKWWIGMFVSAGWSLTLFGSFYFGMRDGGAEGLALAYVAAWLFSAVAYGIIAMKIEKRLSPLTEVKEMN